MEITEAKAYIKRRIKEEGFVFTTDKVWLSPQGVQSEWTFDLKALLLDKDFLRAACDVFWSIYDRSKPIQICGLETASIPLITALVLSGENANGIYIRKSKKKKYDMRELEGVVGDAPIVLVDDVMNTGSSVEKQLTVLKKFHRDVAGVFAFVHLQSLGQYDYLRKEHGIEPRFVFNLADFFDKKTKKYEPEITFEQEWRFTSVAGNEFNVTRRRQMFVDDTSVYLNADDGNVYAFSNKTGDTYWQTRIQNKVPPSTNQGGVIKVKDKVYAVSERGILWTISDRDGSVLQQESLADYLSGDLAAEGSRIFLNGKDGKYFLTIIFDVKDNKIIWKKESPYKTSVAINNPHWFVVSDYAGNISAYSKKNFEKKWEIRVEGAVTDSVIFDQSGRKIFLVTSEGWVYSLNLSDGSVINRTKVDEPFLSAKPVLHNGKLYFTSLHRTIYCLDGKKLDKEWEFNTKGRIFGGSALMGDVVFFGNNGGILHALDAQSGRLLGTFFHGDRIVSEPVCLGNDRVIFQTLSNQIVSLRYTRNNLREQSSLPG